MGQEITNTSFSKKDFKIFHSCLKQETEILREWFKQGHLSNDGLIGGFEIESWLLDRTYRPVPLNKEFLEQFNNPLASPELAKFSLEFNNSPRNLINTVFTSFHLELEDTWRQAQNVARRLSTPSLLLMIGTLPTFQLSALNKDSMSDMKRYRALNEQIMARCKEKFLHLHIKGNELLELDSGTVMLEATTASFQIHTQVPAQDAHHYYNAALMISAPMVAVAANSPYIFGKNLWNETRIPLFEQSIDTANPISSMNRVSFGSGYMENSVLESFEENLEKFCVLLPIIEKDDGTLSHLRLHNGTIWRWNRPLLGFNEQGQPHIRIEHRAIPAGPTFIDMIANAAFYYGLQHYWGQMLKNGHALPKYDEIKSNFYTAAMHSFEYSIIWFGEEIKPVQLVQNILLPQAEEGLRALNISLSDINKYLSIIAARVDNQQTGASWQRKYVALHKCDMTELTRIYHGLQESGTPVHTWGY